MVVGRLRYSAVPRTRDARGSGKASLEESPGRERERIRPGPSHELNRSRETVFGRTAGQRQSRPAKSVERQRVPDQGGAQSLVSDSGRRGDADERRREQEVESLEELFAPVVVLLARP